MSTVNTAMATSTTSAVEAGSPGPLSPTRAGSFTSTTNGVSRLTFVEALVEGMRQEMRRDPDVFLMGQDVGRMGGAMVGAAVGAALMGKRPIVEISFGEFLPTGMNQIVLQAANLHYMTAGRAT